MSRNVERPSAARGRKRSRRMSLLWILAAAVVIIVLITQEQIAILYVLATIGITALLIVVAAADLRGGRERTDQAAPYDDAAAIGDGRTAAATPSTTFGSTSPRALKTRRGR